MADETPVDLSGDEEEEKETTPDKPSAEDGKKEKPAVPDRYKNSLIQREEEDAHERRSMRVVLFFVVLLFAVVFLAAGLSFALDVGYGLLSAKKSIVGALTNSDSSQCLVPLKCITESTGTSQLKELPNAVNLNTDWLSAGSLISIVAFVLGVGLTLILTMLKFSFNHPTDKPAKHDVDSTAVEIATPLSQLIVNFISFLKDKFSK